MKLRQLWFTRPRDIQIREYPIPNIAPDQLLVKSKCSAISAGTEMLVYRGQLPDDIALDASLEALQQQQTYPLQYGYACVGIVEQIGSAVNSTWLNKRIFAFQPHASHFVTTADQLIELPDNVEFEDAVFLANMETAVNLVLDASPLLGERVVVMGQGIVGLLVASLLSKFPLANLIALDTLPERRARALQIGVQQVFDPCSETELFRLKQTLQLPAKQLAMPNTGADLIFEVSGIPDVLNLAIDLASYTGRIIIGSWYGNKASELNLGGVAHRNRLKLLSSQVSTIAPELSGRWDKERRFDTAWQMIRQILPSRFISHRVPLDQSAQLYQLLEQNPNNILQAIITY